MAFTKTFFNIAQKFCICITKMEQTEHNRHKIIHTYLKYSMSQNSVHKLGGKADTILRNHNYIGTPGWKSIGGDVTAISSLACVAARMLMPNACNQHELYGKQPTLNPTTTRRTSFHCYCEDGYRGGLLSGTIYLTPFSDGGE